MGWAPSKSQVWEQQDKVTQSLESRSPTGSLAGTSSSPLCTTTLFVRCCVRGATKEGTCYACWTRLSAIKFDFYPLNTRVLPCSGALLRATQRSKPYAVTCQFCEMSFATTNTCPKWSDLKPNPTLSQQLATKMPLPLCLPVARHIHTW